MNSLQHNKQQVNGILCMSVAILLLVLSAVHTHQSVSPEARLRTDLMQCVWGLSQEASARALASLPTFPDTSALARRLFSVSNGQMVLWNASQAGCAFDVEKSKQSKRDAFRFQVEKSALGQGPLGVAVWVRMSNWYCSSSFPILFALRELRNESVIGVDLRNVTSGFLECVTWFVTPFVGPAQRVVNWGEWLHTPSVVVDPALAFQLAPRQIVLWVNRATAGPSSVLTLFMRHTLQNVRVVGEPIRARSCAGRQYCRLIFEQQNLCLRFASFLPVVANVPPQHQLESAIWPDCATSGVEATNTSTLAL